MIKVEVIGFKAVGTEKDVRHLYNAIKNEAFV